MQQSIGTSYVAPGTPDGGREGACEDHSIRTLALFLLIYVAGLMVFAVFARGWGPLHTDMTEAWAWANEPQLGYSKHPPFSAWMAALWFTVFPRTNWGFYFLSTINAAVGLAGVWMLAGLFLGTAGRLASVLFLVLTPHFTFWALKFNAN